MAYTTPLLRVRTLIGTVSSNLTVSAIFYSSRTHEQAKLQLQLLRMKLRKLNHVFKYSLLILLRSELEKK